MQSHVCGQSRMMVPAHSYSYQQGKFKRFWNGMGNEERLESGWLSARYGCYCFIQNCQGNMNRLECRNCYQKAFSWHQSTGDGDHKCGFDWVFVWMYLCPSKKSEKKVTFLCTIKNETFHTQSCVFYVDLYDIIVLSNNFIKTNSY